MPVAKFRRISLALMLAAAVSTGAAAEDMAPAARGELGVRYWLSTGETKWAHNAQSADPTFGNPTSVLHYENLDANSLEVFGRQVFAQRWFLKGLLGVGRINTGSFDDEDFNAGQVKFSDTTSSVSSGWLAYGTLDFGHQWLLKEGAVNLGVFAGYGQWTEEVEASGATDHLGFIGGDIDRSVKVITNNIVWRALRIGFAGQLAIGSRARLSADLALIPYAKYRNEDSHHLRSDLGPVPNVLNTGEGRGVQFDAELGYEIFRRTVLTIGWRYWYMESTDGKNTQPNFSAQPGLPVVELYSKRTGATLSLRRLW